MSTVFLLDVTPEYWCSSTQMHLRTVFETILFSIRSISLQSPGFRQAPVALIACYPDQCEYLLSGLPNEQAIQKAATQFSAGLACRALNGLSGESKIGMGLSMAVCFISKQGKMRESSERGRVAVFETSTRSFDFSKQSVEISNCGWAALVGNTAIDVVSLGGHEAATVLQQVSLKTGGTQIPYGLANSPGRLLQSLFFTVACPAEGLMKVKQTKLDTLHMGAVCVCHVAPLERGYVCSVCLAVYCSEDASACTVCGSRMRRENRDSLPLNLQGFNKIQI